MSELVAYRCSTAVWLETGSGIRLSSGLPAAAIPIRFAVRRLVMFTIGIDPHKGSHLAAVLDEREQSAASCGCALTDISAIGC